MFMISLMPCRDLDEPPKILIQLVGVLFTAKLPLGMMIATFVFVSSYVTLTSMNPIVAIVTLFGIGAAGWKVSLHWFFYRSAARGAMDFSDSIKWESRFAGGNYAFALAVGALTAFTFTLSNLGAHLLASAMVFGFCSGQVARIAFRPKICSRSILLAALPAIIGSAAQGDLPHLALSVIFILFALAGLDSVRFSYVQMRQRIVANIELETIAGVDPLTGLLNRLGLRRAFEDRLDKRKPEDVLIAVHSFDLDRFKAVNDNFGHLAGDALLVEIAQRVRDSLAVCDIAVRLGGDEFLIVQFSIHHADEAELYARRLHRVLVSPYSFDSQIMNIGISMGSCIGRLPHDLLEDIVGVADRKMYEAKRSGGGIALGSGLIARIGR